MLNAKITNMATLRARDSLPPIAATNSPVLAAMNATAKAMATKPTTDPSIETPKTTHANPKLTESCANAIIVVAIARPAISVAGKAGVVVSLRQIPNRRSRNSSRPQSIPKNSKYCSVMPQKL
jgi:hypothetical protein